MSQPQTGPRDQAHPGLEGMITFLYYKDLPAAARFYEQVMGLKLAMDQGWAKVYEVAGQAHVGLVDERRGYHKASPAKPVMLTLLVPDVDAWYQHLQDKGIETLTEPRDVQELGLRMFLFQDPEGYVIEIEKFL